MNIKAILFLLYCVIGAAKAGHYLFWSVTASKGSYLAMMSTAEELAKRGHEVTLVSIHSTMTKTVEGITEIVLSRDEDKAIEKAQKISS